MWREYALKLMAAFPEEVSPLEWANLAHDLDRYEKVVKLAEMAAMFSDQMTCGYAIMALNVLNRQAATKEGQDMMRGWALEEVIDMCQSQQFASESFQQRYEAQVQRTLAALIQLGVPCDGPSLKPADYKRYKALYIAAGKADKFTLKPKKTWWPFGGHATVAPEPT